MLENYNLAIGCTSIVLQGFCSELYNAGKGELCQCTCPPVDTYPEARADAPAGTFVGFLLNGANNFLGIRYGQPPIGARRFLPALAEPDVEGEVLAKTHGTACVGSSWIPWAKGPEDENWCVGVGRGARMAMVRVLPAHVARLQRSEDAHTHCHRRLHVVASLFLNVWTPAGVNSSSSLPVMFWIHGQLVVHAWT